MLCVPLSLMMWVEEYGYIKQVFMCYILQCLLMSGPMLFPFYSWWTVRLVQRSWSQRHEAHTRRGIGCRELCRRRVLQGKTRVGMWLNTLMCWDRYCYRLRRVCSASYCICKWYLGRMTYDAFWTDTRSESLGNWMEGYTVYEKQISPSLPNCWSRCWVWQIRKVFHRTIDGIVLEK